MTHNDPTPMQEVTSSSDPLDELASLDSKLWVILEKIDVLGDLRPDQMLALIPIARGERLSVVANKLKRGEKTIDRWLKEEAFKKALTATVGFIYTYGLRMCAIATVEAVEVLRDAIRDKNCKMSDRIRAAAIIMEQGERWQSFRLEEKITELEQRLAMRASALPGRDDEEEDEEREDEEEELDGETDED